MDTFKEQFYGDLKTADLTGRELTDEERLTLAVKPLITWYRSHKRSLPWRENKDAYRIWISEIMLQQTRVEAVKPYFERFLGRYPTVRELAESSEEELLKYWEGLGYYSRARNLRKAAIMICEEYGGSLPASRKELLKLPGIGSYTSGAVASIAYGLPEPAVDGNVLRVILRVTGSREEIDKPALKKYMEALVPHMYEGQDAGEVNQALMETGAMTCIPNGEPLCGECPFAFVCLASQKGLTKEIPCKPEKKKRKIEEKTVFVIRQGEKTMIRKRPDKGILASMYEFPNLEGKLTEEEVRLMLRDKGTIEAVKEAKHIFTHIEWHMTGYLIHLKEDTCLSTEEKSRVISAEIPELAEKYPIPGAFSTFRQLLEV